MDFDRFTVVSLLTPEVPPALTDSEREDLQDRHLSRLADLHDEGVLLAAGPTLGADLRPVRGFALMAVEPDQALALLGDDAAVRAGVFTLSAVSWMVPAGAVSFASTFFPRSIADVAGGIEVSE